MYFIKQIQKQFFAQILSYADVPEGPTPAMNHKENTDTSAVWSSEKFWVSQETFQKLEKAKQEQLKTLFDKLSALEKDVVDNNLDKRFLTTGATILARIETDASYKPTAPEDTKAYDSLLAKLKSYQKRISDINTNNAQKREQISMLSLEISQILGEVPGNKTQKSKETKKTGLEINPKATEKFREYLSKKEQEAGLGVGSLFILIWKKYDYSGIPDNQAEKKLTEAYLSDGKNFEEEINTLIKEMKEKNISFKDGISFEKPEEAKKQLRLIQRTNPNDWIDVVEKQAKQNYKSLDDGTIWGKILEFFRKLFGFDAANAEMFNTYGKSKENMAYMIGGDGNYELWSLSRMYESGDKWPNAINPDDNGKPSFGTYQLRGEALGTFANNLGISGNYNQTFVRGIQTDFSLNWKKKIEEIGIERFQKLEHDFIKKTHFDVATSKSGFDVSTSSIVIQNAIWSTAVQHGPATDIIRRAIAETQNFKPGDEKSESLLLEKIYEIRTRVYPEWKNRYTQELEMAQGQLNVVKWNAINKKLPDVESVPKQVTYNKDGSVKMTYCARIARLNAQALGAQVPKMESAQATEDFFKKQGKLKDSPEGSVFQVFSKSKIFPDKGHVATGFIRDGNQYVLDPYLPVLEGKYTHKAIPLEKYKNYVNNYRGGTTWYAQAG
jgi:hypothetical protein